MHIIIQIPVHVVHLVHVRLKKVFHMLIILFKKNG